MMLLNSIRSGDGGECIRAERNWREGMQVFIQIIGYLLLISITMFLLLAELGGTEDGNIDMENISDKR